MNVYLINDKRSVRPFFIGDFLKTILMAIPFISASRILSAIVGVLSLSDMLSTLFGYVSNLMFMFWELIPFLR